ncbi:hypothetical protein SISNIDRAFT_276729 [Sistotremastrum niveocremeum HHB9708]|uniref:Uncharacterized protein n=1 Tax=Sistotremastrum niveocremeum HHB9708 TaxID=1314777 RepID=A0A164NTV7_9AGAM|nr:hypothetical protein SISNIDRAFT_276729 [Sistotremastrum niveocremeum HHB9708]
MPEIIIFSILVCATYHELKSPFSSPMMVLPSSDQAVRTYNGLERHRASDSRVAFVWCGSDDSDRTLLGISWQSPAAYCATAGLVNYVTEAADEYPAGCRDNYLVCHPALHIHRPTHQPIEHRVLSFAFVCRDVRALYTFRALSHQSHSFGDHSAPTSLTTARRP